MVKRHDRGSDGKYHIQGHAYEILEGSRAQVMHGTAYKTAGGLKKDELKMHNGRVVSKKKSELAKSQSHLAGYLQPKGSGVFGTMKNTNRKATKKRSHKRRGSRKK